MKENKKVYHLLIQSMAYIFAFVVFSRYFSHLYLFQWLSHNKYVYFFFGLITLGLTIFKNEKLGYVLTLGNLVGLMVGHYLGEFIRKINMSNITENMDGQTKYQLSKNYGVLIWLICIVLSISLYGLFKFISKKSKNN